MSRAEAGSVVAKVRVYELAKEFGVESKAVMAKLQEMGEFVRSPSSTIEAPVVRRLKEAFAGQAAAAREAAAAKAAADGADLVGADDRGGAQPAGAGIAEAVASGQPAVARQPEQAAAVHAADERAGVGQQPSPDGPTRPGVPQVPFTQSGPGAADS